MRAVDSLNDPPPPQVYANLKDRGAIILTATRDEMQGDFYFVSTIKEPSYDPACQKALKVGAWASRGGPVLHAACSGGVVPLAGRCQHLSGAPAAAPGLAAPESHPEHAQHVPQHDCNVLLGMPPAGDRRRDVARAAERHLHRPKYHAVHILHWR